MLRPIIVAIALTSLGLATIVAIALTSLGVATSVQAATKCQGKRQTSKHRPELSTEP